MIADGQRVGGAVVTIADDGRTGSLDTFFIDGGGQNRGLGLAAWRAIEARYPSVELWTALTPYFDTRNIHFYVNKCGFRIVEFFHPGHPEPHEAERGLDGPPRDATDRMISFEKRMRPATEGGNQPDAASPSSVGSLG